MKIYKDTAKEDHEEYWEMPWWKFVLSEIFELLPNLVIALVNGFMFVIISVAFAGLFTKLLETHPEFVAKTFCQSYND